jgi:hypothetical protein
MALEPTGNSEPADGNANPPVVKRAKLKKAAPLKKAVPLKKAAPLEPTPLQAAPLGAAPKKTAAPAVRQPATGATRPADTTAKAAPAGIGVDLSQLRTAEIDAAGQRQSLAAFAVAEPQPSGQDGDKPPRRPFFFWTETYSSWATSTLAHMIGIVVLGLCVLTNEVDNSDEYVVDLTEPMVTQEVELEETKLEPPEIDPLEAEEDLDPQGLLDEGPEIESPLTDAEQLSDLSALAENEEVMDELASPEWMSELPRPTGTGNRSVGGQGLGRGSGQHLGGRRGRKKALEQDPEFSEVDRAITAALNWLVAHQFEDGSWSFEHWSHPDCRGRCKDPGALTRTKFAATGMALLPFLGAGHSHREGPYAQTVTRGLLYLLKNMRNDGTPWTGSMWDRYSTMYGHGICALVLVEAYGLTKEMGPPESLTGGPGEQIDDEKLRLAAMKAIQFIERAQGAEGSWRYQPGRGGDTSVLGWQLMPLLAAKDCDLPVDKKVGVGIARFLDQVQDELEGDQSYGDEYYGPIGCKYAYDVTKKQFTNATTAIGTLCRMYMGVTTEHPAITTVVGRIAAGGPSPGDLYYNYYANQVMFQNGGPLWESWQKSLTNLMLQSQTMQGHEKGSWFFPNGDKGAMKGGRLYCTVMAAMCLSEHFRHLRVAKKLDDLVESFKKPNPGEKEAEKKKDDEGAADPEHENNAADEKDDEAGG